MSSHVTPSFTVLNDRKDESTDRADSEFGKEDVLRGKIRIQFWSL